MNENNYLIQFEYGGEMHGIHNLSHCDFSKGNFSDKLVMAEIIEVYIQNNDLHKDGAKVTNARLFGKGGELITCVTDFGTLFNI